MIASMLLVASLAAGACDTSKNLVQDGYVFLDVEPAAIAAGILDSLDMKNLESADHTCDGDAAGVAAHFRRAIEKGTVKKSANGNEMGSAQEVPRRFGVVVVKFDETSIPNGVRINARKTARTARFNDRIVLPIDPPNTKTRLEVQLDDRACVANIAIVAWPDQKLDATTCLAP